MTCYIPSPAYGDLKRRCFVTANIETEKRKQKALLDDLFVGFTVSHLLSTCSRPPSGVWF